MNESDNHVLQYQPIVNVGVLGHVAHGKSTLVRQITGIRTQKHSNENKTGGRTIKLGYANVKIFKCSNEECGWYYTRSSETFEMICGKCDIESKCDLVNHTSFVDAPGHEFLMSTMLNGAAVMDCAILVIAANEQVPQPQTQEHLIAAEIMGLTNILIVQNKIDTITPDKVQSNAEEIRNWVKGTCAENSKIIPISAQKGDGVQKIIESLALLKIQESRSTSDPIFACIRSFDVNKPGTDVRELTGGVIGGTLLQGTLRIGDDIIVKPGIPKVGGQCIELKTTITGIQSEKNRLDQVVPGGLIALETTLDPRFTSKDCLVGCVLGTNLSNVINEIDIKYHSLKGTKFNLNDMLRITYLSRSVMCSVKSIKKRIMHLMLQEPLCIVSTCSKVSLSIQRDNQFRLVGVGKLLSDEHNCNGNNNEERRTFENQFGYQLSNYEELLSDVTGICVSSVKKKTALLILPPECEKQGGVRTAWTNFGAISDQLDKPLDHFMKFVTSELGTTTSLSATRALILYGKYTSSNFESLIRSYIRKYCKCDSCGNCETDLECGTTEDTITCKYCGKTNTIYAILNNSKKGKGGKLKM